MSKIASVILAHDNPERLQRLLESTTHHFDKVVVHIDAATEITPFIEIINQYSHVEASSNRLHTIWGHWNVVQATIEAYDQILQADKHQEISHIQLLSNACYPITPGNQYRTHIAENIEADFYNSNSLPIPSLRHGGMDRTEMNHIFLDLIFTNKKNPIYRLLVNRYTHHKILTYGRPILQYPRLLGRNYGKSIIKRSLSLLLSWNKPWRNTKDSPIYKGSQWTCLSRLSCITLIQEVNKKTPLNKLFKRSLLPDESYIPTTLRTLRKNNPKKRYLHLIDWSQEEKPHNWTFLDREGFTNQDGAFFARKISANSVDLLNWIDAALLQEE